MCLGVDTLDRGDSAAISSPALYGNRRRGVLGGESYVRMSRSGVFCANMD